MRIESQMCSPTIVFLIGIGLMCYLKTIKHLFISRCAEIRCCDRLITCKRDVIDSDIAGGLAESTTTLDLNL